MHIWILRLVADIKSLFILRSCHGHGTISFAILPNGCLKIFSGCAHTRSLSDLFIKSFWIWKLVKMDPAVTGIVILCWAVHMMDWRLWWNLCLCCRSWRQSKPEWERWRKRQRSWRSYRTRWRNRWIWAPHQVRLLFFPFQGRRLHFPPICPHLPSRLVLLSHYPVRGKPHNHLSYCLLCARLEIISLSKCKCYTHFQAVTPYQFRMCIKIWVHFNAWLKYIILIFNSMFLTLRDDFFFFKCKQKNLCSVPVCNALMSNFIRLNLNKW